MYPHLLKISRKALSHTRYVYKAALLLIFAMWITIFIFKLSISSIGFNPIVANKLIESKIVGENLLLFDRLLSDKPSSSNSVNLNHWENINQWIASTPDRRLKAAKELGIDKGQYIVAFLSTSCEECSKEALKLNLLSNNKLSEGKLIALTISTPEENRAWANKLSLTFEVISVNQDLFDDLAGPVIIPTFVLYENGFAKGARGSF